MEIIIRQARATTMPRSLFVFVVSLSVFFSAEATSRADEGHFDVVVYGGTSAGVVAAVKAARRGKSVILIEPSQHLGGLTSGWLRQT